MRNCLPIGLCVALIFFASAGETAAVELSLFDRFHQEDSPLAKVYVEGGVSSGSAGTYAPVTLFAPLWDTDNGMIFTDLRGTWGGDSESFASYGFGFRYWTDRDVIIGNYLFYDRHRDESQQTHQQVLLGFEWLSINWDMRLNLYLEGQSYSQVNSTAHLWNGSIGVSGLSTVPNHGSDFEAGYLLKEWNAGKTELRGYLGAYWFDNHFEGFDAIIGPRARVEYRLFDLPWFGNGSRLVASGQFEWDRFRGSQGTAALTLRIPLRGRSSKPLNRLDRRKLNPIIRQNGVFLTKFWTVEPADFPDGREIRAATTISRNTDSPDDVIAELGSNSVVIVDGSEGRLDINQTFVMSNGQTLIGGEGQILVVGRSSGGRAVFTAPGERPTIVQNAQRDGIQLPRRNGNIVGVNIYSRRNSISGEDTVNTTLWNNLAGNAVVSRDVAAWRSVMLQGSQKNILVTGNLFGSKRHGLFIEGSVSGRISNNRIAENDGAGVFIGGDLLADFTGNLIEGNGQQGVLVEGRVEGDITNNTFRDNEAHGLEVAGKITGRLSGNEAAHNLLAGYTIRGPMMGEVSDNTATDNGWQGFLFHETIAGSFVRNTAIGNELSGLSARNGVGDVWDNTFRNNGLANSDNQNHGLKIEGLVSGTISNNQLIDNMGPGASLIIPGGATAIFEGNSLSGNNSGGSEFIASRQLGTSGIASVVLRNNTSSNNVSPGQPPNFQRLWSVELIDGGGNVGSIQD